MQHHLSGLLLLVLHGLKAGSSAGASWDYERQDSSWGLLCGGHSQSPIDIEPRLAVPSNSQFRMEYKTWNLEDVSTAGVELDGVPRVRFKKGRSPGKVQVGTAYSDFDEYTLSAIEVHSPSEHTLRKASWVLELQLWHEPAPLTQTEGLEQHIEELSQGIADSKSRFAALSEAEAKLRDQTMGKMSPWSDRAGAGELRIPDAKQTLDWIDATKGDISEVAALLRQDSKELLKKSVDLEAEVSDLVKTQKRKFADHRVVLSIFVLRASPVLLGIQNGSATPLVRWLSHALAPGAKKGDFEAFEFSTVMGGSNQLYSYEGSVPRPPCTPNVRWFVHGEPQASDIFQLSKLLEATSLGYSMHGDAREVQAFGQDRKLHQVQIKWQAFAPPALRISAESLPPARLKALWISRYCKVFILCSIFLICTPLMFWLGKNCRQVTEDDDLQTPLSNPTDLVEAENRLNLSLWSPTRSQAAEANRSIHRNPAPLQLEEVSPAAPGSADAFSSEDLQGGSGEPCRGHNK